jgi:hypothetical protein
MFGSLKKKLLRKNSHPVSDPRTDATTSPTSPNTPKPTVPRGPGLSAQQGNNSFASSSPATRRPSKCYIKSLRSRFGTNIRKDRSTMNPFSSPSEAPPAYTPGPSQPTNTNTPQSSVTGTDADPYAFLKSFDTVFLIDDSGSMAGRSWKETGKALETITPICTQRDADGIDIYFLNHPDSPLSRQYVPAAQPRQASASTRSSSRTSRATKRTPKPPSQSTSLSSPTASPRTTSRARLFRLLRN